MSQMTNLKNLLQNVKSNKQMVYTIKDFKGVVIIYGRGGSMEKGMTLNLSANSWRWGGGKISMHNFRGGGDKI